MAITAVSLANMEASLLDAMDDTLPFVVIVGTNKALYSTKSSLKIYFVENI